MQAIATVLSLVNPAICGAIFTKLESGRGSAARVADAVKAAVAILVILGLAALFGAQVLTTFGVSLDAFSVAGGFVLAWMGFGMIKGNSSGHVQSTVSAANELAGSDATNQSVSQSVSLSPLILFAASPGTITGVITLSVAHSKTDFPTSALIAIAVAVTVTFAVMLLLSFFGRNRQGGFVQETVTQLMGLIVIAMGMQFLLTGFKAFVA